MSILLGIAIGYAIINALVFLLTTIHVSAESDMDYNPLPNIASFIFLGYPLAVNFYFFIVAFLLKPLKKPEKKKIYSYRGFGYNKKFNRTFFSSFYTAQIMLLSHNCKDGDKWV